MASVNLSECVGYVTGLINAADWETVTDVVLNGTTTVVSPGSSFTQADRGKLVSIAGAAVDGKPLIAVISSVSNGTTIVLDTAVTPTGTGFSMSYGGISDDPRHPLWTITRAVLQKDIEICHAILATPNHPRRGHFTFTNSTEVEQTGTGTPMVSHSGRSRKVEVLHTDNKWRSAKELSPEWLPKMLTWINNQSGLFTQASEGYYCVSDGQLYFTGKKVRINYTDIVIDSDACQAPQEYSGAIAILAAAELFATEGDDLSATNLLSQIGVQTAAALIAREIT